MQAAGGVMESLLADGADCDFLSTRLSTRIHDSGGLLAKAGSPTGSHDSIHAALHNNGVGAAAAAAEAAAAAAAMARRASLEAAIADQNAAQLRGEDVPMLLEDLLPLEDLHDPFLEDLGAHIALAAAAAHGEQPPHPQLPNAQSGQQAPAPSAVDPSDPGTALNFSPSGSGFFGIPAYAEPASPEAALLNSAADAAAAAAGAAPPLTLPVPRLLPAAAGAQHPAVPGLSLPASAAFSAPFGAQHVFAAAQAGAAGAAVALPPAIAVAQQRAAAALAQAQLQAQVQAHMQAQPAQQQAPAPSPQQAERAASCDQGPGTSRISEGSNGSAVAVQHAGLAPSHHRRQSEDSSSGGEQHLADAFDDVGGPVATGNLTHPGSQPAVPQLLMLGLRSAAPSAAAAAAAVAAAPSSCVTGGAATPTASGSCAIFTAGEAPSAGGGAFGGAAPAKRGGRPREKKSYDALIDPNLPIDEIRRLRRMLSNRESARRSRRRRQTQLSTLEVELEQLKSDKERLESELHQTSTFAQQLSAEKQQLLAELERLRCQLAQVSTSPPQAVPAVPAPAPAVPVTGALPSGAPAGMQLGLHMPPAVAAAVLAAPGMGVPPPAVLASCMPGISAVPTPSSGGPGRLPHFIEQAQRLANKLNQPRHKEEAQATH